MSYPPHGPPPYHGYYSPPYSHPPHNGPPTHGPHGTPMHGPHGLPMHGPHGLPMHGPHGPPPHGPHGAPPHGPHMHGQTPYYMPAAMMVPFPMAFPPESQPTYITNYIYHGESTNQSDTPAITDQVHVVETSGNFDWVPTTSTLANTLTGRAVVGGQEGWDGSPLWVIRAWHNGELIPGKLSVRHNSATIPYNGKEVPVQNIEVLCCSPESLRWVPASDGNVPPAAIPGGHTTTGETIYVGRARYQLSLTPGKIQPSKNACYISFASAEVAVRTYDVLCRPG